MNKPTPARLNNIIVFYNKDGYVIQQASGQILQRTKAVAPISTIAIKNLAKKGGEKVAALLRVKFVGVQFKKDLKV